MLAFVMCAVTGMQPAGGPRPALNPGLSDTAMKCRSEMHLIVVPETTVQDCEHDTQDKTIVDAS